MLMVSALAGASAFLTFVAAPQAECSAQPTIVPVSTTPVPNDAPRRMASCQGSAQKAAIPPCCCLTARKRRAKSGKGGCPIILWRSQHPQPVFDQPCPWPYWIARNQ
jgi:hypothetical protein